MLLIGLFLGIPLCLILIFGYLSNVMWKKIKEGSISKEWGYSLQAIFLIPCVFCVIVLVFLIGVFTGIIPLM